MRSALVIAKRRIHARTRIDSKLKISTIQIAFFALAIAAVGGSAWVMSRPSPQYTLAEAGPVIKGPDPAQAKYPYEASRKNLIEIGKSLAKYRAAIKGIKPIAQRANSKDAGVPRALYHTLTAPGKPWTIDKKYFDSPAPSAAWPEGMSYQPVLLSSKTYSEEENRLRNEAWKRFGEQAPVLIDCNMFIDDPGSRTSRRRFER